jgi:hypothetical protein
VAVLVRLRSDRCLYADPPPRPSGATGRPRRHGAKFAFADPATWPAPTATLHTSDDQYGTVTVTCWAGLHPKQQRHPGHGSRGPRPIVRGTIIRVQVERVPARTRPPKVLWLWWAGPGTSTWTWPGARTSAGSTWNTPSASPNRPRVDHPAPAHARAGRPLDLAGAGFIHPAAPGPRDRLRPTAAVGAAPTPAATVPYRVRRGFPRLLAALGSPATAPNLQAAPQAGPRAADPGPPRGIRPSRSPPPSPGRRPPAQPRPPDRAATSTTRPPPRPAASPARLRVNHKLSGIPEQRVGVCGIRVWALVTRAGFRQL